MATHPDMASLTKKVLTTSNLMVPVEKAYWAMEMLDWLDAIATGELVVSSKEELLQPGSD